MVASIIATLHEDLIPRMEARLAALGATATPTTSSSTAPPGSNAPAAVVAGAQNATVAVTAYQRLQSMHIVQAGSLSRISVRRRRPAPPGSRPHPARESGAPQRRNHASTRIISTDTVRTYDLFLTSGQSRISFSFGVMAFVNLVKSMATCYVFLLCDSALTEHTDQGRRTEGAAAAAAATAANSSRGRERDHPTTNTPSSSWPCLLYTSPSPRDRG